MRLQPASKGKDDDRRPCLGFDRLDQPHEVGTVGAGTSRGALGTLGAAGGGRVIPCGTTCNNVA